MKPLGRLKPHEIAQLKRAQAFAEHKFTYSGRRNPRRKPVTIRDYSKRVEVEALK